MTTDAVPELERLSDYVHYHAQRSPDTELIVDKERRVTYAQMANDTAALSRSLLAAGVREGDRVATLGAPGYEFMVTMLASIEIGAVWLGLNPKYTAREFAQVIKTGTPRLVFGPRQLRGRVLDDELAEIGASPSVERMVDLYCDPDGADRMAPWAQSTLADMIENGRTLDDTQRARARAAVTSEHVAVIILTSGTTGHPKAAMLSHRSLVWSFLRQGQRWSAGCAEYRTICNLPINHAGCVGDVVSTCLTVGGTLVCMERFDPVAELELIASERISVLMQIPTMYQILVDTSEFSNADLSSVQRVVWGGAAIPIRVLRALQAPGRELQVVYGQTEAPASICFSPSGSTIEQLTETIGMPDLEIDFRIVTPDGTKCGIGEPGEIQIKHPSVFSGYFRQEQATAEAFTADGFLRTGDQAEFRNDGYVRIVGRLRDMYKSGGYNVYPREIEMTLEQHLAVSIAVVVPSPDPLFDEVGHAFVVAEGDSALARDLEIWCRERLANYKIPKSITLLDEMPMLPIGKVDRQALRQRAGAQTAEHNERVQ